MALTRSKESSTRTVPPRRVGQILRDARRERGITLEQAGLACGRFTAAELADFEAGRTAPSVEAVAILERIYATAGEPLVPHRLRLAIRAPDGLHRTTDADLVSSIREVLLRYLAAVYHLRAVPPGRRIEVRAMDLEVLAEYVSSDADEIAASLDELMVGATPEIERFRFEVRTRPYDRRLNITIATTAAGALIMTRRRPIWR